MPGEWERVTDVFGVTEAAVDEAIIKLFTVIDPVFTAMNRPIAMAAIIYIALLGYALMSGWIAMSAKDVITRLSKVVIVILIVNFFQDFAGNFYEFIFNIPKTIGNFIVYTFDPVEYAQALTVAPGSSSAFNAAMNHQVDHAIRIAQAMADSNVSAEGQETPMATMAWFVSMAPVFVTSLTVALAKVVAGVLFAVSPVVLVLTLSGIPGSYLLSWVKALLVAFMTLILAYALAAVGFAITDIEMSKIAHPTVYGVAPDDVTWTTSHRLTLPKIFPLGILSILAVVMIGQATSIAASIIGAAGINTQQATGFLQIGALNAAK